VHPINFQLTFKQKYQFWKRLPLQFSGDSWKNYLRQLQDGWIHSHCHLICLVFHLHQFWLTTMQLKIYDQTNYNAIIMQLK